MFWKKPPEPPKFKAQKPSREELIAQAKAQVTAARKEIGEETLNKIRDVLQAQERQKKVVIQPPPSQPADDGREASPADRARKLIENMDKAKVADYIRSMSREDKD